MVRGPEICHSLRRLVGAGATCSGRTALGVALLVAGIVFGGGLHVASPGWRASRSDLPGADAEAFVRIARRAVHEGTLELPPPEAMDGNGRRGMGYIETTPYARTVGGRLVPKNSWLMGLLVVPGFLLFGVTGSIVTGLLIGAFVAGIATYRAALAFGPAAAVAASLLAFLGLPASRMCIWGISLDAALAAAMLASYHLADRGRGAWAGTVAGLALFLRPTAVLLLAPLPILAFGAAGRRGVARCLAGGLPWALLYAASNTLLWGAPWRTAYHRSAVFVDGAFRIESHASVFYVGILEGLERSLLSPDGLLLNVPVAWIALVAIVLVRGARQPFFTLPYAAAAVTFLAFVSYTPRVRFAFTLLAVSVAPVAAALRALAGLRGTRAE
jgi:hypothetical protein